MNKNILIVDDEDTVRTVLAAVLRREGYRVETVGDGKEALERVKTNLPDLVIMDIRMPKLDGISALKAIRKINKEITVIMMTAFAAVETAVEAMKLGAFDYIIKPFNNDEVKMLIQRALQIHELTEEVKVLHRKLNDSYRLDKILTNSPKMMELYKVIGKITQTNTTVLITGESGTGKELIANTIHYNSNRRNGPFIKVNCSALSDNLLESELFGHEKGAFTGAIKEKPGRFELAEKGTIFLDEIGEISPALQVKLLRVLQEREFERVGGIKTIKADFRVVAATNRNLQEMVEKGLFREDLYYRLNVVTLQVPPLRERREDIRLLSHYFLQKFAQENERDVTAFDSDVVEVLEGYHWPGNVRELANVIERAVIMTTGPVVLSEDLPSTIAKTDIAAEQIDESSTVTECQTLRDMVKNLEKNMIQKMLCKNNGNKMKTAKDLGMSRRSLLYKIQEYEFEE